MSGRRTRPTTRSSVEPDAEAPTRQTRQNTRRNGPLTESMETSQSQPLLRRVTRSGAAGVNSDPVEAPPPGRTAEPVTGRRQHHRNTGHATTGDLESGNPENDNNLNPPETSGQEFQEGADDEMEDVYEEVAEEAPEASSINRRLMMCITMFERANTILRCCPGARSWGV